VSQEPPDIENLLRLNPKVPHYANAVPSAVTKKVRAKDEIEPKNVGLMVNAVRSAAATNLKSKRQH
jgi:hypothetical protein